MRERSLSQTFRPGSASPARAKPTLESERALQFQIAEQAIKAAQRLANLLQRKALQVTPSGRHDKGSQPSGGRATTLRRSSTDPDRSQQHWLVGQPSSSYPLPMSQGSHAALLEGALKLPPDDRLALATELLHSVEGPDDPEWTQAWSAEIARRIQELDEGKVETIPWPELRAQLRARFDSK